MGVTTALAHSLDTRYPECGHGDAYTILTAPGMRFNAESNEAGQARFAQAMGVKKDGMGARQAASAAADAIEVLFKGLGMPVRLSEIGVSEEGIDLIAQDAMTDFGLHRNVRKIHSVDELKCILASVK